MIIARRTLVAGLGTALALVAAPAAAHHGWSWTTGGNVSLTGIIREAKLGNPHGVLTVDVEGETWMVEVGQPWRNQRAGLSDDMLAAGTVITVEGEPSADMKEKRVKAERITIAGEIYDLYPGRS